MSTGFFAVPTFLANGNQITSSVLSAVWSSCSHSLSPVPHTTSNSHGNSQYWSYTGSHHNVSPNTVPFTLPSHSPPRAPQSWVTTDNQETSYMYEIPNNSAQHADGGDHSMAQPSNIGTDKPKKRKSQHNWALEISAVVLSLSAVITALVLLFYADNRPLAQYQFFISFNTVISILGTIARASLGFAIGSCLGQGKWNWFRRRSDVLIAFEKFDDASRGPWGSLWLLIWLRIRHWTALGALVSIILLGFEPFLQAAISYRGEMDKTTNPVQPGLGATHRLDAGVFSVDALSSNMVEMLPSGTEVGLLPFKAQPDLGISAALYDGFYRGSTTGGWEAGFTCPNGNCTWPLFTSLSVCSACNDVSNKLDVKKMYGDGLGTQHRTTASIMGNFTSYGLPYVNVTNEDGKNSMLSAYMVAQAISDPGRTLTFSHMNTMLVALGIIQAADSYKNGDSRWNETAMTASECALYFCTNVYDSKVEHGVLEEKIVRSWSNRNMASYRPDPVPAGLKNASVFEELEQWHNYSLYNILNGEWFDIQRSDLQLQIPADEARQVAGLPDDATMVFNITQNTLGSTSRFLFKSFFSTHDHPFLVWPQVGITGGEQPPVAQAFYESRNLSDTFDRAAWSVSNWMRDYSNTAQVGEEKEWVVRIHVNWAYLALPGVTFIAGCIFILLSMLETMRLQLEPWKNSVVDTLAHSLDAKAREHLRLAKMNGDGRDTAKAMLIDFEDSGSGLELRPKQ